MTAKPAPARMDADAFLDWAVGAEADADLHDARVAWMASERAAHARAKSAAAIMLRHAARKSARPCEAFVDSLSIRASEQDVFVPDAVLVRGERLAGEVAVEVVADDSARRDAGRKLGFYARLPAFRFHLLVWPEERRLALPLKRPDGALEIRLFAAEEAPEPLQLEAERLALDLAALSPAS